MSSQSSETVYYHGISSPIGPLAVLMSEAGVVRLEFGSSRPPLGSATLVDSAAKCAPCTTQLAEYFAGTRTRFDLPLDLRGTEFQQACWRALLEIPYGETRSYGEIARVVGRPHAFRAVGMANHANPVAIIVPCHRVIGSNGALTGYGGGMDVKRWLLDLERQNAPRLIG